MCLAFVSVFGLAACNDEENGEAVRLIAIDANGIGITPDVDYYVAAEPAASAKVKAVSSLNFVGNLQTLYKGEDGYPQAVVVAKNELINTAALKDFVGELSLSREWLSSEDTSAEDIVNAINSRLTSGLEPTLKVQNLTKPVIANCGIKFVGAQDCKRDIIEFMEKFNSVGNNSFGTPAAEFFAQELNGNAEYGNKISVYAPDGAPAIGLAKPIKENSLKNFEYNIVNAATIQTFVAGASPKADICVLPVNVAVKILGNGNAYKLIGTLTHGNLYLLSSDGTQITEQNISRLKGCTVGVVNLAAVPGLTFKLILKNYGIEYIEPYGN